MVSGRRRTARARPVSTHRATAPIHGPGFRPNSQIYSHINIQQRATTDGGSPSTEGKEEDFIRKESLQDDIQEQLIYKNKLASSPKSPTRPRTFAEATMSTRPRGAGGWKCSIKASDAPLNGPMSLESLGPFRYTFKKKKKKKVNKWSPLDLSAGDSTSDVGSNSEIDVGSSREVSSNPRPTLLGSVSFPSFPQRSDSTSTPAVPNTTPSPAKDKRNGQLIKEVKTGFNDIGDTHQTPTQNNFQFTILAPAPLSSAADAGSFLDRIEYECSLDELDSDKTSDSNSAKDRTEAAMVSIAGAFGGGKVPRVGKDVFDSVEWDPDLPSAASAPDSPEPVVSEPVITAPQPLAYTTVGSLVNPNAAPQFTAPNRIQREGAGRRPLMSFMQNRPLIPHRYQDSSYFHLRDPPAPLSMQSSMHYTQQLAQSPVRFHQAQQPTSSHSSRSATSLQQISLTDDEMKAFKKVGGPQMLSGNIAGSPVTHHPSQKQFISTGQSENRKLTTRSSPPNEFTNNQAAKLKIFVPNVLPEDGQRRSAALSGFEKMQTIQRLAKFENPMQELARSRLSQLSVTNYLGRTVANPTGLAASLSCAAPESKSPNRGEPDRSYQFPPPGFGTSTMSETNPLFGLYNVSTPQVPPASRPSGVPQRLTAGPPGQRQSHGAAANKATANFPEPGQYGVEINTTYEDYLRKTTTDPLCQFYNSSLNQQTFPDPKSQVLNMSTIQPASAQQTRTASFEGEIIGSKLVDTLPISAIAKYYPNGFPSDMTGKHTSLSFKIQMKMGQLPGIREPITNEEKAHFQALERDHYWYSGQRRWGMKIDDFIDELEQGLLSQFQTIGPLPQTPVKNELITAEEMKSMTIAQAAAPAVNALFGTVLAYADETSQSRHHLSGFERPSPQLLVDNRMKDNMSLFGEDRGAPRKPVMEFHGIALSSKTEATQARIRG